MTHASGSNVVWPVRHPDGHIVHASTPQQAMDLERERLVHWPPPADVSLPSAEVTE